MKKWVKRIGITFFIIFILLNIISAFHAYKFTHFYDRPGVKVKKPEQMSGWEKASAVLFGVDYPKRPVTNFPAVPYKTFKVKTSDRLLLEGWYAENKNPKGTVILFHGHAGNKGGVNNEAEAFYNMGFNTCQVDFRAHGNSEGNICTIGVNESADVKAAYDYVTAKGEKNIILWGISLGAATITKAIADYKEIQPSKVILEMPFATLPDAVEGRLKTMGLPAQPFTTLLTFWGGAEQGFWGFDHKPAEYVKQVKVPVLLQWGQHDKRVTEAETNELFTNIPNQQKRLVVYKQSGHQSLLTNERENWMASVKAFLH